jgi:putative ABC transport system permease protein
MNLAQELALSLRLLRRDRRAGELRLLAVAIVIAVASLTSVSFFTSRVERALAREANQLLGGDLAVSSDRPLDAAFADEAARLGLKTARVVRFPSMAIAGDASVLSDLRAVTTGYPLRGSVKVMDEPFGPERAATGSPERGTAWVDDKLLARLSLAVGDTFQLGNARFRIAAVVAQEPDIAIGFATSGPRILFNDADLAATGLVQPASRVRYRLLVGGDGPDVERYRSWAISHLAAGQRIETVRDARPEIRSALERAERFLGLAALTSAILAAVAIALAARRFITRHLDSCAMMRCLGAAQGAILRLYLVHFVVLGVVAAALGCVLGFGAQFALAQMLGGLVAIDLPLPSWRPWAEGLIAGLVLLLGFALPPLAALAKVPTLRVLRRDLGLPGGQGLASYALGVAAVAGLLLWKAGDLRLGLTVLAGVAGMLVASGLAAWGLIALAGKVRSGQGLSLRHGLASLRRRAAGSAVQIVSIGIGLMALLLLTLIRGDLLANWKATLPADAPNRFLVNVQPDQVAALERFLTGEGLPAPRLFPMVRARLTAINDRAVNATDYSDERARRLVEREFNLSWATALARDNRITAGRFWTGPAPDPKQFSMEDGLAVTLGVKNGDTLTFDVAGVPVSARITSLRKVDWDSFNVNFFVLAPPGLLETYPANYVSSFYLAPDRAGLLNALVKRFPNVLVIDVAQVLGQVQRMMDQVTAAVQFVFLFTLAAGIAVLYAALVATQDERLYEATLLRTLGASRRQVTQAFLAEFAALGALAGLLAALGATAAGWGVAYKVLNVPFAVNPWVWVIGTVAGALCVTVAGLAGTRKLLAMPPLESLRKLA